MKIKRVWIVWTNTDTTEGRGRQYPYHICETKATAKRLCRKVGVMGSDGDILAFDAIWHNGHWLAPFFMQVSTQEDVRNQSALDAKAKAIKRAKEAGLDDAEIDALLNAC